MQKINLKTKSIGKILAIILLIFLSASIIFGIIYFSKYKIVAIGRYNFFVELTRKPEKQIQGLGGRAKIREKEGMLFDFGKKGEYSFWMKSINSAEDIERLYPVSKDYKDSHVSKITVSVLGENCVYSCCRKTVRTRTCAS